MSDPIRLYGEKAEDIEQGELFTAELRYVEGRKVVELVRADHE